MRIVVTLCVALALCAPDVAAVAHFSDSSPDKDLKLEAK
jgi:hypothetical protein